MEKRMSEYREIFKSILKLDRGDKLYLSINKLPQTLQAYNALNNLKVDYRITTTKDYIIISYNPKPKISNYKGLLKELKNIVGLLEV